MNKNFLYRSILILLLAFGGANSYGQSYVKELEGNRNYMRLLHKLDSLDHIQDSIQTKIDEYKTLASTDNTNKERYVQSVLDMEGKKFEIRNQVGIITSQVNVIEQEYIMSNISSEGKSNTKEESLKSKMNLLQNKFIQANLTEEELKLFVSNGKTDEEAIRAIEALREKHEAIRRVVNQLSITQEQRKADSLTAIIRDLRTRVNLINEQANQWDKLYEAKVYAYNRLLDKLGTPLTQLAEMSDEGRNIRAKMSDAMGVMFSPQLYIYPDKRELEIKYEKLLAEKLDYNGSRDSLDQLLKKVEGITFQEEDIKTPEMTFITFQSIKVGGAGIHNATNPVTDVSIPTYGSVYMIRLFTLSKKISSFTQLKNIHPVMLFVNEEGKFEYFAGIYPTKEEAEVGVQRLMKLGLRPVIDEWRDGGKVKADGSIIPLSISNKLFKVEIPELTPEITAIIDATAPEKELTKVGNVFSLGVFEKYSEAEQLAITLGSGSKVISIEQKDVPLLEE